MNLNLNIWQRMALVIRLSAEQPPVGDLRKIWGLLDLLELTAEEKAEIDLKVVEAGLSWDPAQGVIRKEIEIEDPELALYLKKYVQAAAWPVGNRADLEDLFRQVGV